MSSPDKLTIETPEQTSLEFPLAGIGSRFLALAADTALQMLALLILVVIAAIVIPGARWLGRAGTQWVVALLVLGLFLINFGYFAFFEAVWNGQTPGKRYAQLRVMKDSGQPITAYEAIVRNLVRIVDALPAAYAVGIVSVLLSRLNKRLGDYVAGTVVVHERPLEGVSPTWERVTRTAALTYDVSPITPEEFQLIETFLLRRGSLEPAVRRHMASEIADRVGKKLSVPPEARLHSETFLEAIAEQRRRLSRYR